MVLAAGAEYDARILAIDPDGDTLEYRWEILRESEATQEGGDAEEIPELVGDLIDDASQDRIIVTAPSEPGAYRLFAYVYDGHDHAGHANIPFYVE